jgi:polysaccharide biosynthesis/export protein
MNKLVACVILFIVLGCLSSAPAQVAVPSDLPIGTADLLDINVLGVPDFTREIRVNGFGIIRLPFLGDIKVEGLTPSQVEVKLTELLTPNYVKDPQVSVLNKEPRSRMYSIVGAVRKPGQYQMLQSTTLVAAIAGAEGLSLEKAGDAILIQRSYGFTPDRERPTTEPVSTEQNQPNSNYQIKVDLGKLMREGNLSGDIPILPGDIISIPERDAPTFYVVGDVNKPGPFAFPVEAGIKISRALAMAGGPTKTSKLQQTDLIRPRADGSADRFELNLDKVLKGTAPDFELKPNDMVFVPGSVPKTLGWSTLTYLPYAILQRLIMPY